MTTQEIYQLAEEFTEQQVSNVVSKWQDNSETESVEEFNSLVRLGDSVQLACATVIAKKANNKGVSSIYTAAYES